MKTTQYVKSVLLRIGFAWGTGGILFVCPGVISASGDLEIQFENGPSAPLFSGSAVLPGDESSAWIKVKNVGPVPKDVLMWTENENDEGLGGALNLTVKKRRRYFVSKQSCQLFGG